MRPEPSNNLSGRNSNSRESKCSRARESAAAGIPASVAAALVRTDREYRCSWRRCNPAHSRPRNYLRMSCRSVEVAARHLYWALEPVREPVQGPEKLRSTSSLSGRHKSLESAPGWNSPDRLGRMDLPDRMAPRWRLSGPARAVRFGPYSHSDCSCNLLRLIQGPVRKSIAGGISRSIS